MIVLGLVHRRPSGKLALRGADIFGIDVKERPGILGLIGIMSSLFELVVPASALIVFLKAYEFIATPLLT